MKLHRVHVYEVTPCTRTRLHWVNL